MDVNLLWWSFCNIHKYQIITLYTWNWYNVICPLYLYFTKYVRATNFTMLPAMDIVIPIKMASFLFFFSFSFFVTSKDDLNLMTCFFPLFSLGTYYHQLTQDPCKVHRPPSPLAVIRWQRFRVTWSHLRQPPPLMDKWPQCKAEGMPTMSHTESDLSLNFLKQTL